MKTLRQIKLKKSKPPEAALFVEESFHDHNVCGIQLILNTDFGEFQATGSARRNPIDKEDPEIAQVLAVSRALASLARGLQRRANGLMKHQEDLLAAKLSHKQTVDAFIALAKEIDSPPEVKPRATRRRIRK